MTSIKSHRIVTFFVLIFSICYAAVGYCQPQQDPFMNYNRHVYKLNHHLDKAVLKPVAKVYQGVLPNFMRTGIANFFNNINMVPTIINDLLQAHPYQATSDTWRLLVNSTIGVGGFIDVGSKIGLKPNSEDFGLTLAAWGYKKSAFVMLPFLGPSTVRDTIALPFNFFLFSVWTYIEPYLLRVGLIGVDVVNQRAQLLRFDNVFQSAALDPYTFERNAFLQRRNYLIKRNETLVDPYLNENTPVNNANEEDPYISAQPVQTRLPQDEEDPYVAPEPEAKHHENTYQDLKQNIHEDKPTHEIKPLRYDVQ